MSWIRVYLLITLGIDGLALDFSPILPAALVSEHIDLAEVLVGQRERQAERIAALEAELRQAKAPRLRPAQHDPMLEELRQTREEVPEPAERRGVT